MTDRHHRQRPLTILTLLAAGLALTGCTVGPGSRTVTVGSPSSTVSSSSAAANTTCRPPQLRADQVPVASGTGRSYLAWSLTDTGPAPCTLPPGSPTLAFVDAAGAAVIRYAVTALPGASAAGADGSAVITVRPGHAVWFLTEESAPTCGTGIVVRGGPFHYVLGLPGGVGAVTWTAPYLSGSTLGDLCPSVSLAVGAIQSTEPAA